MTQPNTPACYPIRRKTPNPVRLSDFGAAADDGEDREFGAEFRGCVTVAEFQRMYPDDDITDFMVHETESWDGWPIRIGLTDVLAVEGGDRSMQHVVINVLRESQGLSRYRRRRPRTSPSPTER